MLTVGATANQNGTALFEGIAIIFLASMFGHPLALTDQLVVMVLAIVAGVGTAGVPAGPLPVIVSLSLGEIRHPGGSDWPYHGRGPHFGHEAAPCSMSRETLRSPRACPRWKIVRKPRGRPLPLANATLDFASGEIGSEAASCRRLSDIGALFEHPDMIDDPEAIVYRTYAGSPDSDRPDLAFATTVIEPGDVGGEFFMTRGHRHVQPERGEYMLTLGGTGCLVLMDETGSAGANRWRRERCI